MARAAHSLASVHPLDTGRPSHLVRFYEDEGVLARSVADFLCEGFDQGVPGVVIATAPHRAQVLGELMSRERAPADLQRNRQLTVVDAGQLLERFMAGELPDRERFFAAIAEVLADAGITPEVAFRAYGEMVDVLYRAGKGAAAAALEGLWNELATRYRFTLLCGYGLDAFRRPEDGKDFEAICGQHTHVIPGETFHGADDQQREIARLQQRSLALEEELTRRRATEHSLRTALAQLEDSRRELSDFVENALEGLHWVGPDGTILWANAAEMELLGYTRDEYVGHNIAEFHADPALLADILRRLANGEALRDVEAPMRHKDGSTRTVLIHSNALFREGKFVHTRCFTRDISDRKRLEVELRRQNDELSRLVKFSEMFAGILGHDLRNPLTAVTTNAGAVLRKQSDPSVQSAMRRILNSTERMSRMVDQLLDFTRIRLGAGLPLERRLSKLDEICRLVIEEMDPNDATRVRLEVNGDASGAFDPDRFAQVVSNLVFNALRHGAEDGQVSVRIDGENAEALELEVHNPGAIDPQVMAVLFEPLKEGARGPGSSGLGLGLYVTREIARAHGGDAIVRSDEATGTSIRVRFPRTASSNGDARGE